AGLVDRAVAVETLAERERGGGRARPGDQLGHWLGTETVEVGLALWAGQLDHFEAGAAVGDVGEQRGIGRADDYVLGVGHLPAEGLLLVDIWRRWAGDVDDDEAVLLGRDIGVSAREIEPA